MKNKITFVIPSRNNLEFLQLAYQSIRNLKNPHDILVLNDASNDGTDEWLDSLKDPNIIVHHNPGPDRIGIVGMFDKGIEMARTEIIMAFHADMIASPNLDTNILKHLERGTVVTATRVEPSLHPPGPEKIMRDWGVEVEEVNMDRMFADLEQLEGMPHIQGKITEGIFAPWCMYKEDFLAVGGHDELFAPQSKEDSDLFNRFLQAGYKFKQPWDALVYHFTSRGSRFNKHAGGAAGKNSDEWLYTTNKNMRNFIRKWGSVVKHDALMKPIVEPKYDIGVVLKNVQEGVQLIQALEPWCSNIYVDDSRLKYIALEQPNTIMDLQQRVLPYDNEKQNGVLVQIDAKQFNKDDFEYLIQLSLIINSQASGEDLEGAEFELGNMNIEIIKLNQLIG
jgi:glycosyltransferase involved in cell wall biosynthesis